MVWLYKDPKGATVFTDHETAFQVITATSVPSDSVTQVTHEAAGLRKRVKHLEGALEKYKVATTTLINSLSNFYLASYQELLNIWLKLSRAEYMQS